MTCRLHPFKQLVAIALLCASSSIFAPYASAQLSRPERKAWKKELRKMTPERLKQMVEEKANLSSLLNTLNNENSHLKTVVFKQEQELNTSQSRIQDLRQKLKTREIQLGLVTEEGEQWDNGVIFKVQIGALRPSNFPDKKAQTYTLEVEDGGNYMQYVLGNFRNYWEADALKKHMRKIGMTKAWIVPYKDGRRVPLKDVLEFVLED
jgi:hypothetical protein